MLINPSMPEPLLGGRALARDFPDVVRRERSVPRNLRRGRVRVDRPNGAGKTTDMRAASGLQESTRGTIVVAGHDLTREPAS